jgi:transposase
MRNRTPAASCPTDLTDAEWAALEPLLPLPAPRGRPPKWPRRLIAEAVFHLVRSGCARRMPPRCFPPWPTVSARFRRWRLDGSLRVMHDRLRAFAREAGGRAPEPSAAIIDGQTARATGVGGPARGYDAAKLTAGRKRHILVDTAGLVLLAHVHAADLHDQLGAQAGGVAGGDRGGERVAAPPLREQRDAEADLRIGEVPGPRSANGGRRCRAEPRKVRPAEGTGGGSALA